MRKYKKERSILEKQFDDILEELFREANEGSKERMEEAKKARLKKLDESYEKFCASFNKSYPNKIGGKKDE